MNKRVRVVPDSKRKPFSADPGLCVRLGAVLTGSFPLLGQAAFSGLWPFLYLNYSNGDFARMQG